MVDEEFHGGNKKHNKTAAVRSAPPRKQHHEPIIEVKHDPVMEDIPTIPDHVAEVVNSIPTVQPVEQKVVSARKETHEDNVSDWDDKPSPVSKP